MGRAVSVVAVLSAIALGAGSAEAATGGAGLTPAPAKRTSATAPATQPASPTLAPVAGLPLEAGVAKRRVGRRGVSSATLAYVSRASGPVPVRVDVVRLKDGLSIYSDERTVTPDSPQTLEWSGRANGGVALDGRYEFRVSAGTAAASRTVATDDAAGSTPRSGGSALAGGAAGSGAAPIAQGSPPPPGAARVGTFTFVGAVFPVQGAYDFGGGAGGRFGAGRGGRSHQGQDIMAKCGTPIVAARGGIVQQRTWHGAAGNYAVIRDPITGEGHMYAHMREPAFVTRGQRVETGQQIGVVGTTGSSSACHLHFEIWTAPGWYLGGEPIDPLAALKRWAGQR